MPLLQCGFLANQPLEPGAEPNNSHELASAVPVPVSTATQPWVPCSGGWGFALAVGASDHQAVAWGVNSATLLAKSGANEDGVDPATLEEVAQGVDTAAAGFDHGLLVADGKVTVFGPLFRPASAGPGLHLTPIALRVSIVQVAAGEHHSLALSAKGDVYAWGSNAEGQLGDGSTTSTAAPQPVVGPSSGHRHASLLQPATHVACGARHSLAINALGQCLAWGWSLHGQCGTGKTAPTVPSPTPVDALGPLKCVGVAGGLGHTVVHTDQGDVYAWGLNADGQLGDGGDAAALQPKLVEGPMEGESVTKVAAGARHTLLLCASGRAYACGWGAFGQLGTGSFASSRVPVAVAAEGRVVDLAAGWWHSLFLTQ